MKIYETLKDKIREWKEINAREQGLESNEGMFW